MIGKMFQMLLHLQSQELLKSAAPWILLQIFLLQPGEISLFPNGLFTV